MIALVRPVRAALMTVVVAAGCGWPGSGDQAWSRHAVAALGAPDGYLFVFSPFNCALRSEQIAAMNVLADRRRRTGRVLTVGHELSDSIVAADAMARLGVRLDVRPLATSALRSRPRAGLNAPLAIAIRNGEVIAVLSGSLAERLDTWLAWLEQWPSEERP
jgi:hypothetical protein